MSNDMSAPENIAQHNEELHAQLRLFCHLMLGSADAADRVMRQIYHRPLDHQDDQQHRQSERARLFRIAAGLCGVAVVRRTNKLRG
jgi:DNA-directed RNA polymerase specialized sigma24 family protein